MKNIKIWHLPRDYNRFAVFNKETNEILDDALGFGYKSPQNAYSAYRNLSKTNKQIQKANKNKQINEKFFKENKLIYKELRQFSYKMNRNNELFDFNAFEEYFKENKINFDGNLYSLFKFYLKTLQLNTQTNIFI